MTDVTYTKKLDNGYVAQRVASTPADHVQLKFDGWTEQTAPKSSPATSSDTKSDTKSSK